MAIRRGINWRPNKDGTFTVRLTLDEISFLEKILSDATHRAWDQASVLEIQARQLGEEWFEKTRPFYEPEINFAIRCSGFHSNFESFIRYGPGKEPETKPEEIVVSSSRELSPASEKEEKSVNLRRGV
jgi:hypothetical protein